MSDYKVKQVIVVRKDLKMRKGKMIAQGAHASLAVILNKGRRTGYSDDRMELYLNADMQEWLDNDFAKICVSANSEKELLDIHKQAFNAGLPCSLIQDQGYTEFDGVPTYTAVAIGPAKVEEINKITGELKLL